MKCQIRNGLTGARCPVKGTVKVRVNGVNYRVCAKHAELHGWASIDIKKLTRSK